MLAKSDLLTWLAALSAEFKVIGAVSDGGAPPAWRKLETGDTPVLDNLRWVMPPKEQVLPGYEPLFTYCARKGEEKITSAVPAEEPTLMFGLRPCDARSFAVLDATYLDGRFSDPYYAARRAGMTTVAYVCESKRWSCFCSSVGDPVEWVKACDLAITEAGEDAWIVTAFTGKGEKLLEAGGCMSAATEAACASRDAIWEDLARANEHFDAQAVAKAVDWEEPVWAEIAERCTGCGICSYLCPTCTCFDIQDEVCPGGAIERYRVRDSCQFCDFTKMGHGHNPRPGKKERVRQRLSHKFKYMPERSGISGCVGCGRCIHLCPVNTDTRKIIAEVMGVHGQ